MKKKWMIFRNEANNHHYLYNGMAVVDFTPGDKITWDNYSARTVALLDKALNSRNRLLVHDKTRYIVVTRGEFIEE